MELIVIDWRPKENYNNQGIEIVARTEISNDKRLFPFFMAVEMVYIQMIEEPTFNFSVPIIQE